MTVGADCISARFFESIWNAPLPLTKENTRVSAPANAKRTPEGVLGVVVGDRFR